jgi:hypothetical protein
MGAVAYTMWHSVNFNPSRYQTVSGAITTSNIASQSVSSATNATNAANLNIQAIDSNLYLTGSLSTTAGNKVLYTGSSNAIYINSGNIYFASDERLKNKTELVNNISVLPAIENLDIWKFSYKASPDKKQLGIMAQDIQQLFPQFKDELIKVESEKKGDVENPLSLNENKLIYILWKGVQELSAKVKDLEEKLKGVN